MRETWKHISEFRGLYKVSNLGRIKSLKRTCIRKNGFMHTVPERILKEFDNGSGYKRVVLCSLDRERFYRYIHRLVAEEFIGRCKKGMHVNHKDLDPSNNNALNLEIVTCSENILHAHRAHGKKRGVRYREEKQKYQAYITKNKRQNHIGYFKDENSAYRAYFLEYVKIHGIKPW